MTKILMLLAAGALTALAFTALPALASAGEYEVHCQGAATCEGVIAGGGVQITNSTGEGMTCETLGGNTSFSTTTTTGTVNLVLTGCREVVTAFKATCTSPGYAGGEIRVNNLTYHIVNLEDSESVPGTAFTNVNITANCRFHTFTGSLFGRIEEPTSICNLAVSTHRAVFEGGAITGSQKYSQITATGEQTDLTSRLFLGKTYYTTALVATWTVHWDHPVKVTCPGNEGYEADCQSGEWCSGAVSGGSFALANTNGETISCSSLGGTAETAPESTVGTVVLVFNGCREHVTFFTFTCSNTGTNGKIETNELASEIVDLKDGETTPGVLLTGVNVTFNCVGFSKKSVTGSILGHVEDPDCNTYQPSHSFVFEQTSHGHQKYNQATTTGATLDLSSSADNGGAFSTTSLTGTATVTYSEDKLNITC